MSASTALLAAVALAASSPAHAFIPTGNIIGGAAGSLCATADDASAQALSDYMAKSHEEKLRAVKAAEGKKNSEIAALKAEIQQLKTSSALATTSPAAVPAAPLAAVPFSEMEAKLASYQAFMAEYIVNAQTQKLLAVKEAELKAEKKFQERLEKLFAASGMALPGSVGEVVTADAAPAVVVEETPYQKRNAQIIAAAATGISRWGGKEIDRAIAEQKDQDTSTAPSTSAVPPTTFELRNAQVVAAAGAGKSRWGDMEVERAKANGAAEEEEEKLAAPVSLEDRVNLGARLLSV